MAITYWELYRGVDWVGRDHCPYQSLERELAGAIARALEGGSVLKLVAEACEFMEQRGLGRVIIVGGFAVELHTGSAYQTGTSM